MIGLIQLVTTASIHISDIQTAKMQHGIVAFIGLEKTDTLEQADKLVKKILNYRIFKDSDGKMNLSLKNVSGTLLLVPQFTLVAETDAGTRPGFSRGMPPGAGEVLFQQLINHAKTLYTNIESGTFGAHMQITLCNDGPVTFILRS